MSNALTILRALDGRLTTPVELTLYGRAALQLGFSQPPPEYAASLDVDGVLWTGQAEQLVAHTNFWQAVEDVNRDLNSRGLYISHFFEEDQLILTPDWRRNRLPLPDDWSRLELYRLGDGDLFLTKLMRYDPQDLLDARFILDRARFTRDDVRHLIGNARVPDIPEIREQFDLCSKEFW